MLESPFKCSSSGLCRTQRDGSRNNPSHRLERVDKVLLSSLFPCTFTATEEYKVDQLTMNRKGSKQLHTAFPSWDTRAGGGRLGKRVSRDTDTPDSACSSQPATFGGFGRRGKGFGGYST
ncbi:hypothetical protein BDN67DRAFT_646075 [Paxillus ammoniavirescens]|nr:hypothetical protein BDN67DRAFT_646075 [Paxillus ammoniavirescens]